jgi:predicted alpha/beta superfamily hydrolase
MGARILVARLRRWAPVLTAVVLTAAATATVTGLLMARRFDIRRYDRYVKEEVRSNVLDERRRLLVHLPDSYRREPSRRYPVLYVLDGSRQDLHTAAAARVMARMGAMPEVIVVGLVNNSQDTRWRDYTPPYPTEDFDAGEARHPRKADGFLRFVETEVIPYIERKYRTQPTRMIAGHSLGGLFVLYSLFEKPDLFQARFAFSPSVWISHGRLRAELEKTLKTPRSTFLYLSLGDQERDMAEPFAAITEVLRRLAPPTFRWRSDITRGATHAENDQLSTPAGLQAYYQR